MIECHPVPSGHRLSVRAFELLQDSDPKTYREGMRSATLRKTNDILQGRSTTNIDALCEELKAKCASSDPTRVEQLCRDIVAFENQKATLPVPYTPKGNAEIHKNSLVSSIKPHLKSIDQRLFDEAAKAGFPLDFFRDSFFDNVTIYCIPDHTNLSNSYFADCKFAVCRIVGANFEKATIRSSEFYTCDMQGTSFFEASIASTHFEDGTLSGVSFQMANIRRCFFRDYTMEKVNLFSTKLDGCNFWSIKANDVLNLATASITMGGGTHAECQQNRASIYKALLGGDAQKPRSPDHGQR